MIWRISIGNYFILLLFILRVDSSSKALIYYGIYLTGISSIISWSEIAIPISFGKNYAFELLMKSVWGLRCPIFLVIYSLSSSEISKYWPLSASILLSNTRASTVLADNEILLKNFLLREGSIFIIGFPITDILYNCYNFPITLGIS